MYSGDRAVMNHYLDILETLCVNKSSSLIYAILDSIKGITSIPPDSFQMNNLLQV